VRKKGLFFILATLTVALHGAAAVPDFKLMDGNRNSPRSGKMVSPRDYVFQISAYYFAESGCGYCRNQFGLLDTLETELRRSNPDFNIEILGINDYLQTEFINEMTAGRTLPWLQDTAGDQIWKQWKVTLRDVRILSPQNELIGVFNLTQHDLSETTNWMTLKTMLLDAAKAVDSDADHLPDAWERSYFGNLDSGPRDDPDHDGFDNFTELAFRTNPTDPASRPAIATGFNALGQFQVRFSRWPGALLNYTVEASSDLSNWAALGEVNPMSNPVNLFDGTGSAQVICSLAHPKTERQISFLRVKAAARE